MRKSVVKTKLARGEPVLITTLHFTDPSLYELTSLMGFDGIWMDLEHHAYSLETASGLMRAARVGASDILIRPGNGEFTRLSRMLEAGAQGIMYPRCRDAAEAAEVVRFAKFAPLGRRGFDGANPDVPYCAMPVDDYVRQANEETFVVIQLEEPAAVHRADEIVSIDGVDAVMLGPADFSILSGIPGQWEHESVQQALTLVAKAARSAGKHLACTVGSVEQARRALDLGAAILFHGADILIVKRGLEQIQSDFAAMGFQFDNRLATNHIA
jgi:4-hydroxy-2-oxoheptanedioate aldolase